MSSKPVLKLDWCSHEAAKYAVEKWHYSKRMPKSKLAKIGVWEDEKFIGVVVFGVGGTPGMYKSYGLRDEQGCELVRVALTKHRSQVTKILSVALSILRKQFDGLRIVVSFADVEHGHHGGIYQGGNWLYAGRSISSDEYIYQGKRWHGRAFRHRFKGMENSPEVKKVKGSSKHRYLMPLDDDMRKRIAPLAKPYPKRAGSADGGTSEIQSERGGSIPTPALSASQTEAG